MQRASSFYYGILLIPGILITFLAFAVFWAPTGASDPLGYGINVVMVNVLGNVVLLGILPACGEILWVDVFAVLNTMFSCIALIQSAIVIMIESQEGDHIMPTWMVRLGGAAWSRISKRIELVTKAAAASAAVAAKLLPKELADLAAREKAIEGLAARSDIKESIAGVLYRQHQAETVSSTAPVVEAAPAESPMDLAKRFIYYEKLFFMLDANSSLSIDVDECSLLFSYSMLQMTPKERKDIFDKFDLVKDGQLNRMEFCMLCSEHLGTMPVDLLDLSIQNMQVAREAALNSNKAYWSDIANCLDSWCRFIVPAIYILCLSILFNTEFTDDYLTDISAPMFEGFGPTSVTGRGIALIVFYSLAVVGCLVAYFVVKKIDEKASQAQSDADATNSAVAGRAMSKTIQSKTVELDTRSTAPASLYENRLAA